MLKIILTGPESCGKTTLARQLAQYFDVPLVEEYAREFFEKKQTPDVSGQAPQYQESDLTTIAIGQIAAEKKAEAVVFKQWNSKNHAIKPPFFICDTDVLTIKIWAEEKYGRCHEWIIEQVKRSGNFKSSSNVLPELQTLYLLCSPEGIAWEADPLRENPNDRDRLFDVYEKELIFYEKDYKILRGGILERFELATDILQALPYK